MEGSSMKKLNITIALLVLVFIGLGIYLTTTLVESLLKEQPTAQILPVEQPKIIPLPLATDIEAGINQYRISQGLSALNSEVPQLDQAAQFRAEQMCAENDWSHNKDWEVLAPRYSYAYAGENLYYGFLQENQAAVAVRDWIASPTHQHNMVDNYNEIGVAVKSCPGFQGEPTAVIVTNYFGVPR
jgi:uncharacterized protein YkwD